MEKPLQVRGENSAPKDLAMDNGSKNRDETRGRDEEKARANPQNGTGGAWQNTGRGGDSQNARLSRLLTGETAARQREIDGSR